MPDATPAPTSPHAAFVAGLPKAEIHVHHVGSASPRIVSELAARHPGTVPADLDIHLVMDMCGRPRQRKKNLL